MRWGGGGKGEHEIGVRPDYNVPEYFRCFNQDVLSRRHAQTSKDVLECADAGEFKLYLIVVCCMWRLAHSCASSKSELDTGPG